MSTAICEAYSLPSNRPPKKLFITATVFVAGGGFEPPVPGL